MRKCKKCDELKPLEDYHKDRNRRVYICTSCYNKRAALYRQVKKFSKVKVEYRNCIITEGEKRYETNKLSESQMIELKELGYKFIFKDCI